MTPSTTYPTDLHTLMNYDSRLAMAILEAHEALRRAAETNAVTPHDFTVTDDDALTRQWAGHLLRRAQTLVSHP